jgi:ABC-type branched-subunit amino acid transport system ATPase component
MLEAFDLTAVAKTTCSALPSGTQRVVEVMRALCARPKVLLLDEPSAGLDVHETQEFARTVRRIREDFGIPVLLIEHDMSLVMGISDYVYVIDFGNPLAEGTPSEVRANPAVVAAYLGQDVA